jgi:hypothetical protein
LRLWDPLIQEAIPKLTDRFATAFIQDTHRFLNDPTSGPMQDQLAHIFACGAKTAQKLWMQRSYLFMALHDVYDSENEGMIAHALHNKELCKDEKCLNGRKVLLMTHPKVLAYGSSDGSSDKTKRVLKEAVVWMGCGDGKRNNQRDETEPENAVTEPAFHV